MDAVDLLINAAGIEDSARSSGPVGRLDGGALVEVYRTSAVGPALVTQAFAGLLARSGRAVVLNLTSKQGSLAGATAAGGIGYAMSKAALNMLTRKLALELYQDRTTVVAMSPGWVQTGMGGQDAPLTPGESVRAMLACAGRLTLTDTGAVLNHDDVLAEMAAPAGQDLAGNPRRWLIMDVVLAGTFIAIVDVSIAAVPDRAGQTTAPATPPSRSRYTPTSSGSPHKPSGRTAPATTPRRDAPGARISGAQQYREFLGGFMTQLTSVETVAAFGDDTTAVLFYYPHTANVSDAPTAECFTVTGGKITRSVLVFDRPSFAPPPR